QKDSDEQADGQGGGSGGGGGGGLNPDGNVIPESLVNTLSWLRRAIELDPTSYDAWHAWALMNYQLTEEENARRKEIEEREREEKERGGGGGGAGEDGGVLEDDDAKREQAQASAAAAAPSSAGMDLPPPTNTTATATTSSSALSGKFKIGKKAVRWLPKWPSLSKAQQGSDPPPQFRDYPSQISLMRDSSPIRSGLERGRGSVGDMAGAAGAASGG
ncbi:unnamed protein product, partial [Ectocarpus fasciculatus]